MINYTNYPQSEDQIVKTLRELFAGMGQQEIVGILDRSHVWLENTEHDNWNGGTYSWTLHLELPAPMLPSADRITSIEEAIQEQLIRFGRSYGNHRLEVVTIVLRPSDDPKFKNGVALSEVQQHRVWAPNMLRLFMSHSSIDKVSMGKFKQQLIPYGISGFIAHEDIEPGLEWQKEIEAALKSMDALAAFCTPDFHESKFTHQEIGWGLGREVEVLPIRIDGCDPKGFIRNTQALSASFGDIPAASKLIAEVLLKQANTHSVMKKALLRAFASSISHASAQATKRLLLTITDYSDEEKRVLWNACENNSNVKYAYGICDMIYGRIGKPPLPRSEPSNDGIPF